MEFPSPMTPKKEHKLFIDNKEVILYETDLGLIVESKVFWFLIGYSVVPKAKSYPVEYIIDGKRVLLLAEALVFVSRAQSIKASNIIRQLSDLWMKVDKPEYFAGQTRILTYRNKKVRTYLGKKEVYFDAYNFISAFMGRVPKGFIGKRFLFWRKIYERGYKGGNYVDEERCLVSWTQIQKMLRESKKQDKHHIYAFLEKYIDNPLENSQPLISTVDCHKIGKYRIFDIEKVNVGNEQIRVLYDKEWMVSVIDVGKAIHLKCPDRFLRRKPQLTRLYKIEVCNKNRTIQFTDINFVSVRELLDYLKDFDVPNLKKVLSRFIDPIKKGSNQRSDPTKCSRHLYSHL